MNFNYISLEDVDCGVLRELSQSKYSMLLHLVLRRKLNSGEYSFLLFDQRAIASSLQD